MSNSEKEKCDSNSKKNVEDSSSGLSFFTANDSDYSSDSESEEDKIKPERSPTNNGDVQTDNKCKLPSPTTLFATVGKPKFLDRPLEEEDIDWTSLSKRYEPLYEYSSVSYPSETVDLSSAERTEASISGAPVKYKTEISETKRHLFLHGKRAVDLSNSNDGISTETQDAASSSKKQKSS